MLRIDRSGKPQFTAIEEEVIGKNESRIVYNRFVKEVLVQVPKRSRKLAARVAYLYQRAITVNMVKRAVLCVDGRHSGLVPSEEKPMVVRQDVGAYTHNWILCEYETRPLSPQTREKQKRSADNAARKAKKLTIDSADDGYMSSNSVDCGFGTL